MRAICTVLTICSLLLGATLLNAQNSNNNTQSIASPSDFREYKLKSQSAKHIKDLLSGLLKDQGSSVRIAADEEQKLIFIQGPAEAHEIAQQLIKNLDQAPVAKAQTAIKPVLRSYRCRPASLFQAQQIAGDVLSNSPQSRITLDKSNNLLIVITEPQNHTKIDQALSQRQVLLGGSDAPVIPRNQTATADNWSKRARLVEDKFTPQNRTIERIEQGVKQLLGTRLLSDKSGNEGQYLFHTKSGSTLNIQFDTPNNLMVIRGDELLVDQFSKLLGSLDSSRQLNQEKIRVIPVTRSKPDTVRKALKAYLSGYRAGEKNPQNNKQPRELNDPQSRRLDVTNPIEQVAFQDQGGVNNNRSFQIEGDPNDQQMDLDDDARLKARLGELSDNVQIQTLDDLDLIILRGRDEDVSEITRIIEQIEQLSVEAEPEISLVPLKHVSGRSLETLANQITQQLVGGRQGRVFVTALVKPNALLVIGWGEAFKAVNKLIEQLDQPVDPESEMKIFSLQHANATNAQQAVMQFFSPANGLAATVNVITDNRTNSIIVRAAPRDLEQVEALVKKLEVPTGQAVNQVRTYKLKNTLANDLADVLQEAIDTARGQGSGKSKALQLLTVDANGEKLLKSGALEDVRITPDPRTNTLIISAPAESLSLIDALIKQLDNEPTEQSQIKVFRIVNGDAESLIRMLRSLIPSRTGVAVGPQLPGSSGDSSLTPLRFSIDERTNSIIASGSSNDLALIEALLLRLDEKDIKARKTSVHRLRNAPAFDVYKAVNEFLRGERRVLNAGANSTNRFLQLEREVVVVQEEVSNSIIISATPKYYDEIVALIEQLDEQPPMVMIQVLIAELVLNDVDEFGVELGVQDSLLFDRSLLGDLVTTTNTTQITTNNGVTTLTEEVIQAASNTPGFNFNGSDLGNSGSDKSLSTAGAVAGQALSTFNVGRINNQLGYGGLVLSAGSENINVLIRALKDSRRLEVLSRPQIMTLDNQPAFIQVGERVPRIVNTTLNQFGQVNTVQLENVGLIVAVTPRINPDGNVVMEVDAEKSELGSEEEGIPISTSAEGQVLRQPRINLTTASTTVSANDGETIILGGLITKSTAKTARRVPYLSDLPLLGNLFRYDGRSVRRTELLIVMTPYIVRGQDDIDRIRQVEEARMNWCAADVAAIHSDIGFCQGGDCDVESDLQVIFPDENPRGDFPQPEMLNMQPTPIPTEVPMSPTGQQFQPMMSSEAQVFQEQTAPVPSGLQPVTGTKKTAWWRRMTPFSNK